MKLTNEISLYGPALYLKKLRTLIIGDVHIGYEEMLQKQGYLIPQKQFDNIINDLKKLFKKIKPLTIIINGDIKHEFGIISKTEWSETLRLIDFLSENCHKLILIKGNHDKILGPIVKKRNLEIKDFVIINKYLICHGNKIIKEKQIKSIKSTKLTETIKYTKLTKSIKTIIIGHEHPSVSLSNARVEKYKSYLIGKYNSKKLIVMPSFNPLFLGTDVTQQRTLSPYIKNVMNMKALVLGEKEILDFGKVKGLLK